MDISGVYLTYGEGDSRPRSSRVKSARYGSISWRSLLGIKLNKLI
jgi:hypothetical protein